MLVDPRDEGDKRELVETIKGAKETTCVREAVGVLGHRRVAQTRKDVGLPEGDNGPIK